MTSPRARSGATPAPVSSAVVHAAILAAAVSIATACTGGSPSVVEPKIPDDLPLAQFDRLWDYSDPAATEARFLELLPRVEASGDRDLHVQLLTQIARTHGLRGLHDAKEYDRSREILAGAEALLDDTCSVSRVRLLLERGRTMNSSGDPAGACPIFEEALTQAQALGAEFHAVDAAHMLGIAATPPEKALEWNERAVELAEAASDPRARNWLGALLNNIGWTYHDMGQLETALSYFERDREFYAALDRPRQERIARWSAAKMRRLLGHTVDALTAQEELRAEWREAGEPDPFVLEELGECLWTLGRKDEARTRFRDAYPGLVAAGFVEPERLESVRERAGLPAEAPTGGGDSGQ